MDLFYDRRDEAVMDRFNDNRLYWLDDLGAKPLDEAGPDPEGFLFAAARPLTDYEELVAPYPRIRDRPEERGVLLGLDSVLQRLEHRHVQVPAPRTWRLPLDSPMPPDLPFPLFVRTAQTSWKLGGRLGRVENHAELADEMNELRRAVGWDATILAREWIDFAEAGRQMYGPVPQEVRVWIVDQRPVVWSFHYQAVVPQPRGMPPPKAELSQVAAYAREVGTVFSSRLVVADFGKMTSGQWCFIEAGPGSCAGTANESAFKAVAQALLGRDADLKESPIGGPLSDVV